MDIATLTQCIRNLPFGKKLPQATYVYAPCSEQLPSDLRETVDGLRIRFDISPDFNVLKFSHDGGISFLKYAFFHQHPHPELSESIRIGLATGKVFRARYGSDGNPPILHRKEALLPPGDPSIAQWARLTLQEEAAGLYERPVTIGFKAVWNDLLNEKRLAYRDHNLIELDSGESVDPQADTQIIHRHRTALFRSGLSKPTRLALDSGLIKEGASIFDYGCGRGSDAEILRDLGYCVSAWDPAFFPDEAKRSADVVNLGYVLNVIENPKERLEVLIDAWSHAKHTLIISTLVKGQEGNGRVQCHGDGVITTRRTFQKYFEQAELQGFIESALEVDAYAVSLGIFAAFRDPQSAQSFLESRRRRQINWERIDRRFSPQPHRRQPRIVTLYEKHGELLDSFWFKSLELARMPRRGEFERENELREQAGTPATVHRLLLGHHGSAPFEEARRRRKEDLLVYLALANFRKRIPQRHLNAELQEDLASHFGSYANAQAAGLELLMSLANETLLWKTVSTLSFGLLDEAEGHFSLHASLIDRLPPILRVLIECGAILYGDPHEADVIKIHLKSRKLTFLIYDDFFRRPFPEMKTRIKVDLARLQFTVFEYGFGLPAQLLFYKERFLAHDHPGRHRMEQISRRLGKLGILATELGSNDQNAPMKADFMDRLAQLGLRDDLTKIAPRATSARGSLPQESASPHQA